MQRAYFESYLKEHALADEWWVSVDDDVLDRVMSLDEVAELEYELPGKVIALLHPAVVDDREGRWVTFDFDGIAKLQSAPIDEPGEPASPELVVRVEGLVADIEQMKSDLGELRVQVDEITQLLREALQINQMKEELAHRQQFIEAGEEALLAKTIRYEEQLAELDQRREDVSRSVENQQQRSA
ncbi:MAG: hypothetical protein ACFB21_08380 [Opitutales bacterium]